MSDQSLPPSDALLPGSRNGPKPVVSVGIPVYNCERYIGQAIESVLAQTYDDFELIISDNCSTDATPAIIAGYHDPRIRVLRNETNVGMVGNFNRLLSSAEGKYTKILCADDYLYPDCLKIQTGLLELPENGSVNVAFCRRDIIGPEGKRMFTWGYAGRPGRMRGVDLLRRMVRRGGNIIGEPASVLFRSEALRRAGGFAGDIPWVLDVDLYSRVLVLGDAYATPEPLCAFRVSRGSWSVGEARTRARDFGRFMAKLRTIRESEVTSWDCMLGGLSVRLKCLLKNVLYKAVLR